MGDFTLPPLPPDFVPNFLTQPNLITNNDSFPESVNRIPLLDVHDITREDRLPRDVNGDPSFAHELIFALDNLSQHDPDVPLTREQWLETAALFSQSLTAGTILFSNGMGAVQLKEDLPLESRVHLDELSKNIEMLHRYFQLPYDTNTSQNYCHKCLTAEGTTPTDWQIQYERCGHNATATREHITNQYIQAFRKIMDQWYESQRAVAHDHIVLRLTNDEFAPEILTLDPRIRTWIDRAVKNTKAEMLTGVDAKAKKEVEDQYQHALATYETQHQNDLALVRDNYERKLAEFRRDHDRRILEAEAAFQAEYQTLIDQGKANRPTINDPTARKKRRGSVSTVSSPTNTPLPNKEDAMPLPWPTAVAAPPPAPPAPPTDPMLTQIMNLMSEQFGAIANRLNKLEASKPEEAVKTAEFERHTESWDNIDYDYAAQTDNLSTWNQPEIDKSLANQARVDLANIEYDNEGYVDPPNHPSYMGATPDITNLPLFPLSETTGPLPISQDSDCVLLSGPPTPTKNNPNPAPKPGLRPPERAQRVDFTSGKLASDSFGIPVGGVMKADGSISYNNGPTRPTKKGSTNPSLPPHMRPYSLHELQDLSKSTIISHASFAFNKSINKKLLKDEVIRQYLNAATNATKPGSKQSTLSFANAAASKAQHQPTPPTQRQTTPSSWSRSPTPPANRNRSRKPQSPNTNWVIRPRMGNLGLSLRPFNGDADKLTEYYRQRLQANAGESRAPLTLVHGAWARGPKSIFSLTFAGHVPVHVVRAYSALFLEKFNDEHIFHPGGRAIQKIALFNIPIKRDASGFPQRRHELFQELSRGGSPAGLALYDGPTWTTNSAADPESTTGTVHIMVHDTTGSALGKFFAKPTYMYNKRIAMQVAIDPKPFAQCSRCHRLGHEVATCTRPANVQICYHCGDNHASSQHKYACKAQHSGPTCDCRPKCFLCRIARKPPAQSVGHNALDSTCPLRRHTFVLSNPTNADPTPANV